MDDSKPLELEQQGEYDAAAAAFATAGFQKVLSSHARLNSETRLGIGMLLEAISCDVRIDNKRRAAFLYDVIEPLLTELAETSETTVLRGVATEWLGDAALLLERPDTVDQYRAARAVYEGVTWDDKAVVDDPDFMHSYWAMEGFAEHHGAELPPPDRSTSFQKRIDAKLDLAGDVLST